MTEKTTAPHQEDLMELAEMFLDDEGQTEVSVLLDENEIRRAQRYLLGGMDRCMQEGAITEDEAPKHYVKLRLSNRDVELLRRGSVDLW